MNTLALVLVSIFLGVAGQIFLKIGVVKVGEVGLEHLISLKIFSILLEKHIFLGLLLYGISSILWIIALSRAELSYIYPLLGISYVLIAIFSKLIFGEALTFTRIVGILLIVIGVSLVASRI